MIGQTISHYRIIEELGGGGMGVVYRAEDTRLGRSVALKFLPPELSRDPEARERFKLEARAASALDHANICVIHDIDETPDGQLFIAMAWYEGGTLKERLADGPLDIGEAVDIARQVAAGLERAHESGIVHRDIKPANLMITRHGEVRILDFGIAKLAGEVGLTRTGSTLGTLSYMAPEQVEGKDIGPAADLWSLGVVLYEMLTGTPPFQGADQRQIVSAILARDPVPPTVVRPEVPPPLEALVLDLVTRDPARRPRSAADVRRRLAALAPGIGAPSTPLLRRPAVWVAAAVAVLLIAAAVVLPAWNRARTDTARDSLARAGTLAKEGRYTEAYALAERAASVLGEGDSTLAALWPEISEELSVRTEPPGADVHLLAFTDGDVPARELGTTPIEDVRLARDDYLLTIELEGYAPIERLVSTGLIREESAAFGRPYDLVVQEHLFPADSAPAGMVWVPGGTYALVSADAPAGASADLDGFFIDRFEVTNADYLEFVRAGGYAEPAYWTVPFRQEDEAPLSREAALARLIDRTRLPGPRSWTGQRYPEGADRRPVSDVSWYEAAAYCAFRGGSLPTLFEWEKAAREGRYTHVEGFVAPWGLVPPGQSTERRANFGGTGTVEVDAHPFGQSPFGAYAMAGNVREWTANEAEEGRIAMGGSWRDPSYVFSSIATPSPMSSSPALGFRCVRHEDGAERQGGAPIRLARRSPSYHPVDRQTFRTFLDFYRYDAIAPEPEIIDRVETEDWERVKVSFAGLDGDRILAYLYLPRSATPPYQTIAYVPAFHAFFGDPIYEQLEWFLAPIIRSGRAAFTVVMDGMVERPWPPGQTPPAPPTVGFRDLMVRHATELRLGLDYLETRDDIDMDRLAYVGLSWGAGSRALLAAVDDRFDAVIFAGGGIDERLQPVLPEAFQVNFLPYIDVPKLMLNGRQDEEHPWLTRALPFWELLSEPKELVLVENEGHAVSVETRVPAINGFLDRVFGPVR